MNAASAPPVEERLAAPQPVASRSAADRFMRRLLRVNEIDRSPENELRAHRSFRTSLIVSGLRCLISYLLIPILVPVIGFAGVLAAPAGLALCLVGIVNGVYSVRRFWLSDHRYRWMYTWFIAVVFAILAVSMAADISRMVNGQ
ncbi:MAG: hypothetical protein QM606_06490 [Leucobacter sp.]